MIIVTNIEKAFWAIKNGVLNEADIDGAILPVENGQPVDIRLWAAKYIFARHRSVEERDFVLRLLGVKKEISLEAMADWANWSEAKTHPLETGLDIPKDAIFYQVNLNRDNRSEEGTFFGINANTEVNVLTCRESRAAAIYLNYHIGYKLILRRQPQAGAHMLFRVERGQVLKL